MRRLLVAAAMFGAVQGAQAADLPDLPVLRGAFPEGLTTAKVNWQGYYIGGQAGYGSSDENFNGTNKSMTASILANTTIESELGISQWPLNLGKTSARTSGFGGFVGYNSQWDDVVIGIEASYLHGAFGGSSSASERRFFTNALSDGYYHDITSSSTAAISISDMATFRARAGYAYGSFLPYLFGGVALGNADITRTVSVVDKYSPSGPPGSTPCSTTASPPFCFTPSLTSAQHGHLVYGYSAGLGVDVNLVGGLFLRAEWEYLRFTSVIDTSINTVRAGLGYKF
jgi:outer membrane immunogenic protein